MRGQAPRQESQAERRSDPARNERRAPRQPARGAASTRGRNAADVDVGALSAHLGYLLRRAQVWTFQDFIRTFAPLDIRPAQYSVMQVISANPGISQTLLADALGIERARLVRLLDALEGRGLTRRSRATVDRRAHQLRLTAKGSALLKRLSALAREHEARLGRKVGPRNRDMLLRLLSAFARG
jgi:DNA-binding MarR family transcriptional regulator